MPPNLLPRSNGTDISSPTIPKPLYIVGFTLAGCLVLASVSWFALRYLRKVREKRALAEAQGEQGLVTEMDGPVNHILRYGRQLYHTRNTLHRSFCHKCSNGKFCHLPTESHHPSYPSHCNTVKTR